ncbi:hypothetical protein [Calycomorphotria hydatis]|uniref:Uncharacterized protein n=1 Tax=Calycomorphotria hydatis TaxID=2528027 RepID=A0A517T8Q9_9PLAN|nr:hypothetical protein [Calycomorphotria hydatis]QDT64738.1 hypothetical protein V22_19790 [Calycomorphotria hydatis]
MAFYKLKTLRPCSAAVFFAFLHRIGVVAEDDGVTSHFEFVDGTGSIYRFSLQETRTEGLVSCDATVLSQPNQIVFGHISRFVTFVSENDLGLRRGKVELHPSVGSLFSDLKCSEAFRRAMHSACHPNDQQAGLN